MGDVVNLNRFRKARNRDEQNRQAARNRARYGQSKIEKVSATRETERQRRELDGKRLDDSGSGSDDAG